MRMHAVVAALGLWFAPACDVVFDLDRGPAAWESCSQLDDPARYRQAQQRYGSAMTQFEATRLCSDLGMTLVEANDTVELALLRSVFSGWGSPSSRVWIGGTDELDEGTWRAATGCPLTTFFGSGGEDGDVGENCATLDLSTAAMQDTACSPPGGVDVIYAGCELVHPPSHECFTLAGEHGELFFDATLRSNADAAAWCLSQGARMLEPNSSAELDDALQVSGGAGFWLGADHTTGRWVGTVSSCPPVFRWADPPEFGNGDCPFMEVSGAVVTACGDMAAATVCERRP